MLSNKNKWGAVHLCSALFCCIILQLENAAALLFPAGNLPMKNERGESEMNIKITEESDKKVVVFKTVGERELVADLYPPLSSAGKSPVFFYFHGGGWKNGSKSEPLIFASLIDRLRADGVTLISVGYRRTRDGLLFPVPVDDCIDAVRFFVKNAAFFGFDTEKLFAGGSSAGGHLALMTAFAQNCFGEDAALKGLGYRIQAVVDLCGPVDLNDAHVVRGQKETEQILTDFLGDDRTARPELLRRASPITYIRNCGREALMPIIAVHGTEDELVHHTQPLILKEIYEQAEVPFELVYVENGAHAFTQVEGCPPPSIGYQEIQDRIYAFLKKHVLDA